MNDICCFGIFNFTDPLRDTLFPLFDLGEINLMGLRLRFFYDYLLKKDR